MSVKFLSSYETQLINLELNFTYLLNQTIMWKTRAQKTILVMYKPAPFSPL